MANILYENGFPIKAIVNGKLVDVAEVRHGRWADNVWCFTCSECGNDAGERWDYCPHCGAKMDEEDQPKRFWPEQVEKIMIEAIAKAVTKGNKDECVVGCDGICEECPMGKEENK